MVDDGTAPDALPIPSLGAHPDLEHGACVMEYAALLSGGRHSDHPARVHPVLAELCRRTNDALGAEARASLIRLVPALIGTETSPGDDRVATAVDAALRRAEEDDPPRWPDPTTIPERVDPGAGGGTALLDRPTAPPRRAPSAARYFALRLHRGRTDAEVVALLSEVVHATREALHLRPVPTEGPAPRS